jgi:hypothetical protein
MWRAFGREGARVALVLKLPDFSEATGALNIMFSPVAYSTESQAHDVLHEVAENIRANNDFLRSLDRSVVVGVVYNMLVVGVCCLKHEGFLEEREWRVIYTSKPAPSSLIECSTEVVGGIPQIVHKLPLDWTVSDALSDLDVSRIFDRLIIGPGSSQYSSAIRQAFVAALDSAGVTDAEARVVVSGIPIRD